MQRLPSRQLNTRVCRDRDFRELSRLVLLLCCGLFLTVGFVFAARQHFAAVEFGYQSEGLRNERQQLLAEQQRLLLEKEQVSAPSRLESAGTTPRPRASDGGDRHLANSYVLPGWLER